MSNERPVEQQRPAATGLRSPTWSRTWTFLDGNWHHGNAPIMGARTHASWLGSVVFDGARAFEGVTPDLDLHYERVNRSARRLMLQPLVSVEEWMALTDDGRRRFPPDADLYIRPMYWAEAGGPGGVLPDAGSTRWCLCLYESPLPEPAGGALTLSPFTRPAPQSAPLEAKASCLYPNNGRAMAEAQGRGFDNCLLCDMLGNVAELASANVFMARDGVVYTPMPNGTFLDGITRQRVIKLLRQDGIAVVEATLRYADFQNADEIFSTGNYSKVAPYTRIDDRVLRAGPFFSRARELYWAFAHG
jgi:branched-chain amino acid aminotransferase